MKKIKKAIIPAAGLGTRFFPATKTIPKEMLPIVDRPTILYVVEEAMNAGIEDIVLIAGRGKHSIEDFFDISYEVEDKLVKAGKEELLESLNQIRSKVNIISVRQKNALGLGHAIQCAKPVIGDESFAVLLGDEITLSRPNAINNVTSFLCKNSFENDCSSVWVLPIDAKDSYKYGIVDLGPEKFSDLKSGQKVLGVVEKPKPELAPSTWALPGRYVFKSEIFNQLDNLPAGVNGEIQLSDAMNRLAQKSEIKAYSYEAHRFDAGDKLGFIKANLEVALANPELRDGLLDFIRTKIK